MMMQFRVKSVFYLAPIIIMLLDFGLELSDLLFSGKNFLTAPPSLIDCIIILILVYASISFKTMVYKLDGSDICREDCFTRKKCYSTMSIRSVEAKNSYIAGKYLTITFDDNTKLIVLPIEHLDVFEGKILSLSKGDK